MNLLGLKLFHVLPKGNDHAHMDRSDSSLTVVIPLYHPKRDNEGLHINVFYSNSFLLSIRLVKE
jgi:hypothetical protein